MTQIICCICCRMSLKTSAQTLGQTRCDMTDLIDYEALDAYLMSDSSPDECMMLSDMDGFLHGLACGPSRVPSDEWLGVAFGTDATTLAGWVVEAIETRSAQILSNLQREAPVVEPVFWQAPEGHLIAMDWCEGFMQAVALRPKDWLRLTESGTSGHLLQPIMTHILDENGNSVLGIPQEDLDAALDDAAARVPDAVVKIFLFWQSLRTAAR
ncbi:hypothetical protein DFK10_06590 [Salibaculum griseiflavum]|uniref:YecA family protein n=2 Tax=Salibaculum griseiflavum TaxID=1914409 RepID=A0A2V1P6K8_9RHOB|nr:hypothetical protein DFK10_06590 [Salibaculum griseiflavum]